jgi:hypothetical protein
MYFSSHRHYLVDTVRNGFLEDEDGNNNSCSVPFIFLNKKEISSLLKQLLKHKQCICITLHFVFYGMVI